MSKLVIEAESKKGFLEALERAKKKFESADYEELNSFHVDNEEEPCATCDRKEQCEMEEKIETTIDIYRDAITVILGELELLPHSIVETYNDLLLKLQPYVEDEEDADCKDS